MPRSTTRRRILSPARSLSRYCQARKQFTPLGSISRLPRRQREAYRRAGIRGNPSWLSLSDGLRAVFSSAPIPSGCTFTTVLSSDATSTRMCIISRRCSSTNTRSSTPFFAQRFMRGGCRSARADPATPCSMEDCVQDCEVVETDVLAWKQVTDLLVLFRCDFHGYPRMNSGILSHLELTHPSVVSRIKYGLFG